MPLRSRICARHLVVAAAILAGLAGCTDDGGGPPEGVASSSPTAPPATSPPPVTSADSYVFTDAAGIEARLTLDDGGAALRVVNETGGPLPRPGVYVLDARDGARVDWTVLEAKAARVGRSEWRLTRPAVPEAKHIGLVVLLFGGEDYGAFVPPGGGGA